MRYQNTADLVACLLSNDMHRADDIPADDRAAAIAAWLVDADDRDVDEAAMGEYLPTAANRALSGIVCRAAASPTPENVEAMRVALAEGVWAAARHWIDDAIHHEHERRRAARRDLFDDEGDLESPMSLAIQSARDYYRNTHAL